MALEREMPALDGDENPELRNFSRRFWWTLPLTVVLTLLAMAGHGFALMSMQAQTWAELVLTTP